jgi:hypothetical protein
MSRREAYSQTLAFLASCTEAMGERRNALSVMNVPELGPFPEFEAAIDDSEPGLAATSRRAGRST